MLRLSKDMHESLVRLQDSALRRLHYLSYEFAEAVPKLEDSEAEGLRQIVQGHVNSLACEAERLLHVVEQTDGIIHGHIMHQQLDARAAAEDPASGDGTPVILRTPDEWLAQPEYDHIHVADPDGWDGSNPTGPNGWQTPLSQADFEHRLVRSTIVEKQPRQSSTIGEP